MVLILQQTEPLPQPVHGTYELKLQKQSLLVAQTHFVISSTQAE